MKKILFILAITAVMITLPIGYFVYTSREDSAAEEMRSPIIAHHHMRMQYIQDGEAIDFSQSQFQETYMKGMCSGDLAETPIHFHDDKDQIVHIHWDKITGGQVLKYYGLNLIGGSDDIINYQPEERIIKTEVPIKGDLIQEPDSNNQYWVYTGSSEEFTQRSMQDFTEQDLETFFGKKADLTIQREKAEQEAEEFSFLTQVQAHNDDQGKENLGEEPSQEELKELQSMIGDVIIFTQENEPSSAEIANRFSQMLPLENSVCGG